MSRAFVFSTWNQQTFWRHGGDLPCSRPWLPIRGCCDVWRRCCGLIPTTRLKRAFEWGVKQVPREAPDSRMLRAQFWTLAQSKYWGGTVISLQNYFPKLELDSMSSPPSPNTNVDTNINVKNRRCAINLRGFSFAQHPILKFQAQGDTHWVKMKSKPAARLLTQWLLNGKLPVRHMDMPFSLKHWLC